MGRLQRFHFEVEVTFGEVGIEMPAPEAIAEIMETLLMVNGGLDIEVVVVDVEGL